MTKRCPFSQGECNSECSLFISLDDLNESFSNKLGSIGILDKKTSGSCSLKMLAMSSGRYIFENTATKKL